LNTIKNNPHLMDSAAKHFRDLQQIVFEMSEKRGGLFLQWLKDQNLYLKRELSFKPTSLRKYNRAEIIFVNFGFNPGSEIGGFHYAVVVDDNEKSNPIVNVVPLGSLSKGESKNSLHKHEIYIGIINGLNHHLAYAIPNQLRPISKLRIYKPKNGSDQVIKLPSSIMDLIDEKVVNLFTKVRSPERQLKLAHEEVASSISRSSMQR
jgi:mRNA interferase MazF